MLGSLKNSSSEKNPNFPQQKLKMPGMKFCFDRKMRPSMESQPIILLMMDCEEIPKKYEAPASAAAQMYSSQVCSNTMLYFYHLRNMILVSYQRE